MGPRHDRDGMLAAAVELAGRDGLGALTFGRLASALRTSDRMIVYYFPTKSDLISAVVNAVGADLQALLERAFGSRPLPPRELGRRAWPVLTAPAADRLFALFFETVGLAAVGRAPFTEIAPALVQGWVAWLEPRVRSRTDEARHTDALALVSQLDGLLLLRQIAGPQEADAAARRLGFLA